MAKKKVKIHKIYPDPREKVKVLKYVKYQGHAASVYKTYGSNKFQAQEQAKRLRRWIGVKPESKSRVRVVKTEKGWAIIQYNERGSQYATPASWLDTGVLKKMAPPKPRKRTTRKYTPKTSTTPKRPRAKPGELTLEKAKKLDYGDIIYAKNEYGADGYRRRWRVNGAPKTWKKRPNEVSIPLKYGMYTYDRIDENDLKHFSTKDKMAPWKKKKKRK
jgi:hypothetical protein